MQWYWDVSIARKFTILNLLLISSLLIALTVIFHSVFEHTALEIAADGYMQKFDLVSNNCMRLFDDAEQLTKSLITDEDIQIWFSDAQSSEYSTKLRIKLQAEKRMDYIDAIRRNNQYSSLSAFSLNGDMINTNNIRSKSSSYSVLYNEFIKNSTRVQWIDLYENKPEGSDISGIAFVRPYRDPVSGQIMGHVMVVYNDEILHENFEQLRYGDVGGFIVGDDDGNIKLVSDMSDFEKDYSKQLLFQWTEQCHLEGCTFLVNKERYLITTARIDTLDWVMAAVVPISVLTQKGDAELRIIYILCLITLVIAAVISRWMVYSITRPLAKLAFIMERFGYGQLQITVPIESNDEIGTLYKVFNNMTVHIQELVDQVYNEQRDKRKFEFSALQAQINPHFLYNTLNSVCSLIKMNRPDDAFTVIHALGNFYRTALSNGETVIPIYTEASNILSYIQIQQIRYGNKIQYEICIDESVKQEKIVKFTLQPLVENAIYHGIKPKGSSGIIRIKGWTEGSNTMISVQDDGVGMTTEKALHLLDPSPVISKTSYGLNNIHRRLKLYFGTEYGLSITSIPGEGTTVTVSIPGKKENGEQLG